jgi:hypothetical protein
MLKWRKHLNIQIRTFLFHLPNERHESFGKYSLFLAIAEPLSLEKITKNEQAHSLLQNPSQYILGIFVQSDLLIEMPTVSKYTLKT